MSRAHADGKAGASSTAGERAAAARQTAPCLARQRPSCVRPAPAPPTTVRQAKHARDGSVVDQLAQQVEQHISALAAAQRLQQHGVCKAAGRPGPEGVGGQSDAERGWACQQRGSAGHHQRPTCSHSTPCAPPPASHPPPAAQGARTLREVRVGKVVVAQRLVLPRLVHLPHRQQVVHKRGLPGQGRHGPGLEVACLAPGWEGGNELRVLPRHWPAAQPLCILVTQRLPPICTAKSATTPAHTAAAASKPTTRCRGWLLGSLLHCALGCLMPRSTHLILRVARSEPQVATRHVRLAAPALARRRDATQGGLRGRGQVSGKWGVWEGGAKRDFLGSLRWATGTCGFAATEAQAQKCYCSCCCPCTAPAAAAAAQPQQAAPRGSP